MDVERDQIIRDLKRRSTVGDPAFRAAAFIEAEFEVARQRLRTGAGLPLDPVAVGAHDINESAARAERHVARQVQPDRDTTTRDLLTKETLSVLRQEREHDLSTEESTNDYEYIELIGEIFNGQYKHIGRLISLTARYAGELPHDLIHPSTRRRIQLRLKKGEYESEDIRVLEVESEIGNAHSWETFVDPGLAGNARIACTEVASLLPRLTGMNMNHVNRYTSGIVEGEPHHAFLDFFCAVVACTWRFNSVMAAQPYKTKFEHEAVGKALRLASNRLHEYSIENDHIQYRPRRPPRTLQALRGDGGAFIS